MASANKTQKGLRGLRKRLGLTKKCPKGYILRAPYKRYFTSTIKRQGYSVHRNNVTYRIYPKVSGVLVQASCVKDQGLPGKGPKSGKGISGLRKGELAKFGYNVHLGEASRREALKKAVKQYGALETFRKLDAVAKLTLRTAPEASRIFRADRDWIQRHFPLVSLKTAQKVN